MSTAKHLAGQYRSPRREKPILLRSGGLVLGFLDAPDRPRKSGLRVADYLVALGGTRLLNGDIDYADRS